jgi:hypothetical protein
MVRSNGFLQGKWVYCFSPDLWGIFQPYIGSSFSDKDYSIFYILQKGKLIICKLHNGRLHISVSMHQKKFRKERWYTYE